MSSTGDAAPGMDHRITTAIVVCVGGTLAFTLMLALFSSSVPSGADAATGTTEHAAPAPAAARLEAVVRELDRATYRYRRQHGGTDPDFAAHPKWEQFLNPTDPLGRVAKPPAKDLIGPSPRTFGPYLATAPVNPLNGRSDVAVTDGAAEPGDRVSSGPAGFVFSTATRQFRATDETGRTVHAGAPTP
jgi:hypothetical protein